MTNYSHISFIPTRKRIIVYVHVGSRPHCNRLSIASSRMKGTDKYDYYTASGFGFGGFLLSLSPCVCVSRNKISFFYLIFYSISSVIIALFGQFLILFSFSVREMSFVQCRNGIFFLLLSNGLLILHRVYHIIVIASIFHSSALRVFLVEHSLPHSQCSQ